MVVTPPTPTHLEALTPVHLASYRGQVKVLEQLADGGWSLSARDSNGLTPLHWAAMGGSMESVRWLVQRGGDPHVQDKAGRTPMDVAVQYGQHAVVSWIDKNTGGAVTNEDRRVMDVVRLWSRVLAGRPAVGREGRGGSRGEGGRERGRVGGKEDHRNGLGMEQELGQDIREERESGGEGGEGVLDAWVGGRQEQERGTRGGVKGSGRMGGREAGKGG